MKSDAIVEDSVNSQRRRITANLGDSIRSSTIFNQWRICSSPATAVKLKVNWHLLDKFPESATIVTGNILRQAMCLNRKWFFFGAHMSGRQKSEASINNWRKELCSRKCYRFGHDMKGCCMRITYIEQKGSKISRLYSRLQPSAREKPQVKILLMQVLVTF